MGTPNSNKHAVFGPVTSITTAPVSVGNTLCGAAPVIKPINDGVRVMGRDFMFPLAAVNSAVTDWVLVGGCPIIPHAFVASVLRSYASIYAEYVVHGLTFHYVTAMPTSATGDVMFYINKDRGASLLDTTNTNFMSVVLSDPNTVLGPLWHNHTATYRPVFKTYPTSILNDEDMRTQGPGELFIYMKTSANQTLGSPGYVLVDFDISFKTLQTNPRELTFPLSRLKYNQYGMSLAVTGHTAGDTFTISLLGTKLDGTIAAGGLYADPATQQGDIYKVILMPDYSVFIGVTPVNLLASANRVSEVSAISSTVSIDDGFTCFAVLYAPRSDGAGAGVCLYPTYTAARSQSLPFRYAITGSYGANLPAWFSLVGNVNSPLYQSNY